MYKIKLFSAPEAGTLQATINEWLHHNKDIMVHNSNLANSSDGNLGLSCYTFYILYTGADEQGEALKEMAAAVTQEQSVEVKEINPEILKATS